MEFYQWHYVVEFHKCLDKELDMWNKVVISGWANNFNQAVEHVRNEHNTIGEDWWMMVVKITQHP